MGVADFPSGSIELLDALGSAVTTAGRYLGRGVDACVNSRVSWLIQGAFSTWFFHAVRAEDLKRLHLDAPITKVSVWWEMWLCPPQGQLLGWLAKYGCLQLALAIGGGRIPISGKAVAYVATQTATKFLDALVTVHRFVEDVRIVRNEAAKTIRIMAPEPLTFGSNLERDNWKRRACPWTTLGLAYLAFRMYDGFLMGRGPVNTLPFKQVGHQLVSWANRRYGFFV